MPFHGFRRGGWKDADAFRKPAHSQDTKSRCQAAFCAYPPLVTKQSAGRPLSRSGQSVDWPACGRLRSNRPALTGGRAADYSFGTRGNTLCKGGMRSTDGGVLGGSPNKWNFAVKIPYLLGQRRCPHRCVSYKNLLY